MRKKVLINLKSRENGYKIFNLWEFLNNRNIDAKIGSKALNRDLVPKVFHDLAFLNEEDNELAYEEVLVEFSEGDLETYFQEVYESVVFEQVSEEYSDYGFLVTLGSASYPMGSYHYVETYSDIDFMVKLLWQIRSRGGNILVITLNYDEHIPFMKKEQIVRCNGIKEYNQVLDSKCVRYDIVIDGVSIPRFSLKLTDSVQVEYGKYYAELQEKYIPYPKNRDNVSPAQSVVKVLNGFSISPTELDYFFDNSNLKAILFNEYNNKGEVETYSKLYREKLPVRVINNYNATDFAKEFIRSVLELLEGVN